MSLQLTAKTMPSKTRQQQSSGALPMRLKNLGLWSITSREKGRDIPPGCPPK
jgi:hypothetical protein